MRLARIAVEVRMKRMLIGLLLLGMVVSGVACSSSGGGSGGGSGGQSSAYNNVKDELQNAVTAYATEHQGTFPCDTYGVIDMSALLTSNGGLLHQIPAGTRQTNCAAGGASGCSDNNHYTWLLTSTGIVYSSCVGSDCNSNDASGYQGVWP